MNRESNRINFANRLALHPLRLTICPTTGGYYQLSVSPFESVAGVKCTLARKLRLHAERMSLLYKDRLLLHGSLLDNQVSDGSHLTLVPNMETGTANKSSNCRVMQALENLSESQVNDFLTGRAPLLLAMKLGEHMMFVQLQLSTSSCSSRRRTVLGGNPAHCSNMNNNTQLREKPNCACNPSSESPVPSSQTPGAIIDSVNHLGQGVYSGSFSGTLDPTMQDPTGRPKRDINTILQILNDLLLASPQLRQSAGSVTRTGAEQNTYLQQTSRTVFDETVDQTESIKVEDSLRGKVQTLQKMMHERKLRRQQKRGLKAPYQWSSRVSSARQKMHTQVKFESPLGMDRDVTKTENHANTEATFSTASATAMEHESVLV